MNKEEFEKLLCDVNDLISIYESNMPITNDGFDIEKIKVVHNEDMVDEYNRRSAPFIEEILQLRKQNQNLATQRDMLLPRLMSGKLEV